MLAMRRFVQWTTSKVTLEFPLAEAVRKYFTFVIRNGMFTPTRVPEGGMNATSYFQVTAIELRKISWEAPICFM